MFKTKALVSKLRNNNTLYKNFLRFNSFLDPQDFGHVGCFCLFIGYPRSGHTIIGALLDAHPEIVISIEADVLGLIEKGYTRKLIYTYILRRSKLFVRKLDATWTRYSYKVPGLYQGSYRVIRLIGDKKGAKTTTRLIRNFELLHTLESLLEVPVKMVHVVRNPFDNISTILLRDKERGRECNEEFLKNRISYFFANADMNLKIIQQYPERVLTVYHEDFIKEPRAILENILSYFNIDPSKDYIDKCSNIVRSAPSITRDHISWPDHLKVLTMEQMMKYPFFERYRVMELLSKPVHKVDAFKSERQ